MKEEVEVWFTTSHNLLTVTNVSILVTRVGARWGLKTSYYVTWRRCVFTWNLMRLFMAEKKKQTWWIQEGILTDAIKRKLHLKYIGF